MRVGFDPRAGRVPAKAFDRMYASKKSAAVVKGLMQQALASQSLSLSQRPYNAVPAWTSGEAGIQQGYVRQNEGNLYESLSGGTCGASAPTRTDGMYHNDGALLWAYAGPVIAPPSEEIETAPVFESTLSAAVPAGLNSFDTWANRGLLTFRGGYPVQYGASRMNLRTFTTKPGSMRGMGASVALKFNGLKLGVEFLSGTDGGHITVDGRPVVVGSVVALPAGSYWSTVTFPNRRVKTIEMFPGRGSNAVGMLAKAARDRIGPANPTIPLRGVVIGDSYFDGSSLGPFSAGKSLAQQLGQLIGVRDLWQFATGGTGLINTGTSSYYTYIQRVPEIIAAKPDFVLVWGSPNDTSYPAGDVSAAATALMRALPDVPILWFGTTYATAGTAAGIAAMDAAIAAGVAAAGKRNAMYHSMYNAGTLDVFNAGDYLASGDVHPVIWGTTFLAHAMADIYRNHFLPFIS